MPTTGWTYTFGLGGSSQAITQVTKLHHNQTEIALAINALANERRRHILHWLKEPRKHFPAQVFGDLVKDGVCSVFIADKLEVSAPTASEHLKVLTHAGLIRPKRIRQWTFYKRDEARIKEIKKAILEVI